MNTDEEGRVKSRMAVQPPVSIEKETDEVKASVSDFDTDISCRFK